MKLLVFSDSHGVKKDMEKAVQKEAPDGLIHLGDYTRDGAYLAERFPELPLWAVAGNCDWGADMPALLTPEIAGRRLFLTHGHLYGVKQGYLRAIYAAQEAGADVLLFGHTHRAVCGPQPGGIWMMNPGACGGASASYGVLTLPAIDCRIVHCG